MKKTVLIFVIWFCLFSCNTNSLDGYYYDFKQERIFNFDKKASHIFYLKDSVAEPFTYSIVDEDILEINRIKYSYRKFADSLVFLNFEKYEFTLGRFDLQEISIEDLKSTSWKYDIKKPPKYHDIKLLEHISFNFDRDHNLIIQQNEDTLNGLKFVYANKYFGKFPLFKSPEHFSQMVPIQLKADTLKILSTGNSNYIYTFYKLK